MTTTAPFSRAAIALPEPVQEPPSRPFPLLATLAPVVVSLLIWAITSSPFALVFAALGPVVAIASLADGRVQASRQRRRQEDRFAQQCAAVEERIGAAHASELAVLEAEEPDARGWIAQAGHARWRTDRGDPLVTLGRGRRPSTVRVDGAPRTVDPDERLLALLDRARWLEAAPVPSAASVGVVGPVRLAAAVARGYLIQLAVQLPPDAAVILVHRPLPEDHWMLRLPHPVRVDVAVPDGHVVFRWPAGSSVVATATSEAELPPSVRTVLTLDPAPVVVRHDDRTYRGPLRLEFVPRPLAAEWADRLHSLAERSLAPGVGPVPARVDLAGLPDAAGGLRAPIGRGPGGVPIDVDLVADGPHAVVGGTTGSGKSELLIAWVLAIARSRSPESVVFLLADFKGGASFRPLEGLPHCVGTISDLSPGVAARALASLRAEVRHRERVLAGLGARAIDEVEGEPGSFPRLVIVVDEFAALVSDQPELHALFADLAARGRSLGIHLVLCTQRPAGAVRDAVLANADIRLSLRVNNRADSASLVGSDAAAAIPPNTPGRALLAVAGADPVELQTALADPGDASLIAARWRGAAPPRRPWLDPLPDRLGLEALPAPKPGEGIRLGLADRPDEQAQPVATWRPIEDGHLLVLGGARSGKSSLLATLEAEARDAGLDVVVVPPDPESAWDVVTALPAGRESGRAWDAVGRAGAGTTVDPPERLVLVDDVDALLARMPDEYAAGLTEALTALLRAGPSLHMHVVLAAQRSTSIVHQLSSFCEARIVLRMPSRQDHVMAGVPAEFYDPAAPAGRGVYRSQLVQFARSGTVAPTWAAPPMRELEIDGSYPLAVVTTRGRRFIAQAREAGVHIVELAANMRDIATLLDPQPAMREAPGHGAAGPGLHDSGEIAAGSPVVLVGDPAAWQGAWGAIAALSGRVHVLFDGCSLTDIRSLTRSRELPPLVLASTDAAHLLELDGSLHRVRLSWPQTGATEESASIQR